MGASVTARPEPPPEWVAVAYDAGANFFANYLAALILELTADGDDDAHILGAVRALILARLELDSDPAGWFARYDR
jgi:hypothetical protein